MRAPFARLHAVRPLTAAAVAAALAVTVTPPMPDANADTTAPSPIVVAPKQQSWVFRDGAGREVTLRGFNVSGSTKLYENGLLPFRSTADAATSAQAMRDLTGANVIRFLISWEGVQPAPDRIDHAYLDRAIEQIRAFTDRGIRVLLDYHQDLYSAHLFHRDSWYTGDGAPKWVIGAGNYPREFCGICLLWGQNMMTNAAVRQAARDFWNNRVLTTSAGPIGVQDAFLEQASAMMAYLERRLPAQAFDAIVGIDPFNEPFDGGLDGATGLEWEKTRLMPFYRRFRAAMDAAGWSGKPLFAEPLVFWNTGFFEQGGLATVGTLGTRMVFNSHYYDGARMTLDPSPASDGTYAAPMNRIRDRAASLGTAAIVSEFGNRLTGATSDRTPWMVRSMYQALDHGVPGEKWWDRPSSGGTVLSGIQWHWDIYSGRHREPMNGNPDKVQTDGDAWNDEDHSVVRTDDAGRVTPRLDRRVLDRLYPAAVAGDTLAFAYEDLARSGHDGAGRQQTWLTVPPSMPNVAALVKDRQYGVLAWREAPTRAPTELHMPASFAPAGTVVVSDLGALDGVPSDGVIRIAQEIGSRTARRLIIEPPARTPGAVHYALIVNAASGEPVTSELLAAARAELEAWKNRRFP
ncbi:endoglycosylceramidase [Actinomadura rubrobrunea]|uniref:Endoglycosylceramidase n=1 Tax=Actinomadura rubrobrunea TaxID=115335 RepID=A0A9W6Q282_9ACTN|nr:cellulase family glycosylhydrolase [Actinomadura rubrobrunea]GLW67103.1 endoglycosylceramidase [Actinomadura rubrobrunea]